MPLNRKRNYKDEVAKITSFIKTSFKTANRHTACLAVSGGIDSAVSLHLAALALGPENVKAFHLPAKNSNPIHEKDAYRAMRHAGLPEANQTTISISAIIQKTWRIINHYNHPQKENDPSPEKSSDLISLRLANIAARTRMVVIFDQAKQFGGLVVGTENLSEHLLGYFTRYGDEASDLEPIQHLFKTEVISLAKHLKLPEEIIKKAPSADLWRGQTDEKELGFSYEAADPILEMIVNKNPKEQVLKAGFPQELTEAVFAQVDKAAFKQEVPYTLLKR